MTFTGNHNAQNGEREYQNRTKCVCGADDWNEAYICKASQVRVVTDDDCNKCVVTPRICGERRTAFVCKGCGFIEESI